MSIYVESRDLDFPFVGFVAEHQYLIYVPDGQELNYDAWLYIGAFPADGDGSLLDGGSVIPPFLMGSACRITRPFSVS